jgi:hypothetical protein
MKTEALIKKISQNISPVKLQASPLKRFFAWFLAAFFMVSLGVVIRGFRGDVFQVLDHPFFIIETVSIFILAILASMSAFILSIPNEKQKPMWQWVFWVPTAAWLSLLIYRSVTGAFVIESGLGCIRDIVLIGLLPGAALFYMLSKAAPIRLGFVGALAALSMASIAAVGIQFTCSIESPLHLLFWHLLPVLLIAGLGIALGRWLLHW